MTQLNLPAHGTNNWDVQVNNAFYALEDRLDLLKGWQVAPVPGSPTANGSLGQVAIDGVYLYLCVAPNTWRRVTLASW
jgi:hypothetical protein